MPAFGALVVTAAPYIGAAAGAATLINSFSGKGSSPAAPATPAVAAPTKLPLPEETGRAAEKASLVEMQRRRGRASTILTDTTDTLGA